MNKSVAAVILNYNSTDDCKKCILFLKKQEGTQLTIIVVDNNSSHGAEELETFCKENDCLFIAHQENRGYSAGNNVGLKKASELGCVYALIINPDVEIRDSDYIQRAVAVMDNDDQIAVFGTDIINMYGQHQNPMREVSYSEELFWPLEWVKGKLKKRELPYVCDFTKSGYCSKVSGCCLVLRMSFLKQIGFLDETVFLYCEEPILAATVAREGMREYYCAELVAYHMHIESAKGDPKKRLNEFYKSRLYYLKEYSGYKGLRLKLLLASRTIQNFLYMKRKDK